MMLCFGGQPGVVAADAEPKHSLESIYSEVDAFLLSEYGGEQTSITVKSLDSRLRLSQCSQPLSLKLQRGRARSGKAVVEVRCRSDKPWRLYVSAIIRQWVSVLVTAMPVQKGEKIRTEDLVLQERQLTTLRQGFYKTVDQVVGKFAKKDIRQDVVLNSKMLFVPNLVSKGDQVLIQTAGSGLKVQMKGIALEDGFRDGRIQVQNSSSGKVIEGTVVGTAKVVVGGE